MADNAVLGVSSLLHRCVDAPGRIPRPALFVGRGFCHSRACQPLTHVFAATCVPGLVLRVLCQDPPSQSSPLRGIPWLGLCVLGGIAGCGHRLLQPLSRSSTVMSWGTFASIAAALPLQQSEWGACIACTCSCLRRDGSRVSART